MGKLEGQTAIVTGSSRGIGRAIALELARHGAAVAINYRRRQPEAEQVVDKIVSSGGRAAAFQADVSDSAAVHKLIVSATQELGEPDVLVTNAGTVQAGLFASTPDTDWQRMFETHLLGTVHCIREVVPTMLRRRRGSIVCVSSIVAERGAEGLGAYAAAKGAVLTLVRTLAIELGKRKIRVNAVTPGIIDTDMTRNHLSEIKMHKHIPLKRVGEPHEVACAVRFLASEDASYITGESLRVGGGLGA